MPAAPGEPTPAAPGEPTPAEPTEPSAPLPAPSEHAITCEQVAIKAAELIGAEAQERAKSMTADQVEDLEHKLESELPAVIENILAECAKADWSDASRTCVIDARTLAQATTCN